MNHTALLLFSLGSLGLMGCGPTQVHLDPRNVTTVALKVPTQAGSQASPGLQATFCPGSPIRVEVRASLKDGSVCSSTDAAVTCMGEKGSLIDASQIRLQGTAGVPGRSGDELLWLPPRDALATAEKGLSLRAWIESSGQKGALLKSSMGQLELRPQYECLQDNVFTIPAPEIPGQSGAAGPDLKVAATLIATPFYPEAMLVRVEAKAGKTYILATDRTKPVTILSKGQNGAEGIQGRSGGNGADGAPAPSKGKATCEAGNPGMSGLDGTPGGHGGDGGPGGTVQLFIDESVGDQLKGWLKVGSVGGDGGRGGTGGAGGVGGRGGGHSDTIECTAHDGQAGKNGARGPDGDPGRPGVGGPTVKVASAPLDALFGNELPAIQRLKAGAASRPGSASAGAASRPGSAEAGASQP